MGRGDVTINLDISGKAVPVKLRDCVHAPDMAHNLISLSRVTDQGFKVVMEGAGMQLLDGNGRVGGYADRVGRLYQMRLKGAPVPVVETALAASTRARTLTQWHHVLGHTPVEVIRQMQGKGLVQDLAIDATDAEMPHCAVCWEAKQTVESFPKESQTEYTAPGQLIVSDVWGPSEVASIHGEKFLVTFTDVYSRYSFIKFLKAKSGVAVAWEELVAFIQNQANISVKKLRADNGGEYISDQNLLPIERDQTRVHSSIFASPEWDLGALESNAP